MGSTAQHGLRMPAYNRRHRGHSRAWHQPISLLHVGESVRQWQHRRKPCSPLRASLHRCAAADSARGQLFDIYRKIPKDLTQPTVTGAVISILSCFFISILFLSEFISYMSPELVSELYVDNPSSADKIPVSINITLLKLDCNVVGLDIQDDMGRHEVGFVENTEKTPVGSGCRFEGKFFIHKVPGNFHVSTHAAAKQPDKIDMTHIIHDLTFGVKMTDEVRGSFNSLDEMDKSGANGELLPPQGCGQL
ncbi:hypothetical protein HPB49_000167 [Dermacentor silvarum]|uniref:Uncharacterized protein n=1 Tax=Dermacentor silvarum TaxID=543639 RepID=A0ACB8DS63_DERSI|nr:hypothetical protein HPB49_000167 [Dermacentor silvarum]